MLKGRTESVPFLLLVLQCARAQHSVVSCECAPPDLPQPRAVKWLRAVASQAAPQEACGVLNMESGLLWHLLYKQFGSEPSLSSLKRHGCFRAHFHRWCILVGGFGRGTAYKLVAGCASLWSFCHCYSAVTWPPSCCSSGLIISTVAGPACQNGLWK